MASRTMHCHTCQAARMFEPLPWAEGDGHDVDAQEWLCTACGEAVLIAPLTVLAVHVRTRQGGIAPRQRRAA